MVTVHPLTAKLYRLLPEVYRDVDLTATGDRPLLRFLSLVVDQLGEVEDLIDRIDPAVLSSELLDPWTADSAWLPWLAQMLGVGTLPASLTVAEQRQAIAGAVSGYRAGIREAIVDAARSALTDPNGYVSLRPHYSPNPGVVAPDPHVIGVSVDPESAPPDLDDVVAAIIAAGAKPAGIALVIDLYAASWATTETKLDTWNGWEAKGSWVRVEATEP